MSVAVMGHPHMLTEAIRTMEECTVEDSMDSPMHEPPALSDAGSLLSAPDVDDSEDDLPPELTSPTVLSFDTPPFVPAALKPKPHSITLFSAVEQRCEAFACDLAQLTVGELRQYAEARFPLSIGNELHTLSTGLINAPASHKAIDVGVGNNAVVVLQPKSPSATPVPLGAPPTTLPPIPTEEVPAPLAIRMIDTTCLPPATTYTAPQEQQQQQQVVSITGMNGGTVTPPPGPPPALGAPQALAQTMTATPPRQIKIIKVITTKPGTSPSPPPTAVAQNPHTQPQQPQAFQMPAALQIPIGSTNGELASYASTNDGARALVNAIDALTDPFAAVERLVDELRGDLPVLCTHQHGSKVVRALARRATPVQAEGMMLAASPAVACAVDSTAGSDAVADLVSRCDSEAAHRVTAAALCSAGLPRVCCSVQGRRILLACLGKAPPSAVLPLYQGIARQLLSLATDQCGCITLQRCLDYASAAGDEQGHGVLRSCVLSALEHLITDPYGNYVIQHLVKEDPAAAEVVADYVAGRLHDFGCNKYASNVVERCLESGGDALRQRVIAEVSVPPTASALINDAYGNFVVQSSVENAPAGSCIDTLRTTIAPLLNSSPYGYRIEAKLQRRLRSGGGGGHGGNRGGRRGSGPRGNMSHSQQALMTQGARVPPPTAIHGHMAQHRSSHQRSPPTARHNQRAHRGQPMENNNNMVAWTQQPCGLLGSGVSVIGPRIYRNAPTARLPTTVATIPNGLAAPVAVP